MVPGLYGTWSILYLVYIIPGLYGTWSILCYCLCRTEKIGFTSLCFIFNYKAGWTLNSLETFVDVESAEY